MHNVKYTFKLSGNNKNFQLGTGAKLEKQGTGIITKRDVNVTVKNPLTKEYDAGKAVKDASGNVITGAALNNLVELDGLTKDDDAAVTKKDNATYTTTAVYTDQNAGTGNRTVNYTVNLDAASAGNYNLIHDGGSGNAFSTNDNTITKRTVKVDFKKVSKTYDTTTANPDITGFVSDADAEVLNADHANIAQADPANENKKKLQNLGGLTSNYGAGDTDANFTTDPNAGDKDVQYAGLRAAMNNTLGAGVSDNYEFAVNGYGKGTIDKATINTGDIDFGTPAQATKTYDGTTKVKKTVGGVESADKGAVKGYIPQFMWNGHDISDSVDVDTAEYDNKNVNGGAVHNVKYTFKLSDNNKNFKLGTGAKLEKRGTGIITKRDVNVTVKNPLTKEYDADTVVRESGRVITGAALNDLVTLDGLTKDDDAAVTKNDNATYTTTAEYDNTNLNAGTNKQVNYTVNLDATSAGNYNLIHDGGSGNAFSTRDNTITPRRIYADVQDFHPVKVYDKNGTIVGSVKDDAGRPLTEEDLQKYAVYRHYVDPTTGDPQDTKAFVDVDATPHMTAKFSDEKVAWKDGSWRNTPQGDAKDVVYAFSLSGASAAENYEFVDQDGKTIMQSVTGTTRSTGERPRADGRIDPYRIELRGRSEPYEIRVNEAVPSTFDGSPIGRNYSTPLGESLDGEISYRADVPAKGPRWGIDYPIYGHYQPGSGARYQNYYFDSVPGTLRVNTYVPDYEYDKAMTQVSKMTPDEYAYENASLDRKNQYSRKPTAQVDPVPPAINVVKDGVDIRQNDINVLDDTVYTIVDEVFG